jgi:hypothetical protein
MSEIKETCKKILKTFHEPDMPHGLTHDDLHGCKTKDSFSTVILVHPSTSTQEPEQSFGLSRDILQILFMHATQLSTNLHRVCFGDRFPRHPSLQLSFALPISFCQACVVTFHESVLKSSFLLPFWGSLKNMYVTL